MELTGIPAVDRWTFAGLVALTVLSLLRGWIVPKILVDRMEAQYGKENETLSRTVDKKDEQIKLQGEQLDEVLQVVVALKGAFERFLATDQRGVGQ